MVFFGASTLIMAALGAASTGPKTDTAWGCRPIPEASATVAQLNAFWNRSIRLCQSPDPAESAVAMPEDGAVYANRQWLADVGRDYGWPAAIGILAHEWAHMIRPDVSGPRAELEADCAAGAFLRRAGYGKQALERFALLSLHSGDFDLAPASHGSGSQRRAAVLRGYYRFERGDPWQIVTACRTRASLS